VIPGARSRGCAFQKSARPRHGCWFLVATVNIGERRSMGALRAGLNHRSRVAVINERLAVRDSNMTVRCSRLDEPVRARAYGRPPGLGTPRANPDGIGCAASFASRVDRCEVYRARWQWLAPLDDESLRGLATSFRSSTTVQLLLHTSLVKRSRRLSAPPRDRRIDHRITSRPCSRALVPAGSRWNDMLRLRGRRSSRGAPGGGRGADHRD